MELSRRDILHILQAVNNAQFLVSEEKEELTSKIIDEINCDFLLLMEKKNGTE